MTEEKTNKTACPNCNTIYKLPSAMMGKVVTCKRCGTKFKAEESAPHKTYPAIAKLALRYQLITQEQLDSALEHYETVASMPGKELPFEKILFEKGYIDGTQLELLSLSYKYWQVNQLSNGFCVIAINKKIITQADAETALKAQSVAFSQHRIVRRVSDILIEAAKITPQQRDIVLAAQGRLGPEHPSPEKSGADKAPAEAAMPVHPADSAKAVSPSPAAPSTEKETPEPAGSPAEEERSPFQSHAAIPEGGEFEIFVPEDGLSAILRPTGGQGAANSLSYIHGLLEDEKIIHGIIPDNLILAYMESGALEGKPLTIAQGTPPKPGRDAVIKYYVETGDKKEKVALMGAIDYRDRGQLPHVNKGDLLAKKIPAVPGEPGTNVYGQNLLPPKVVDQPIRNGSGTLLSADGMTLTAETAGQPKITFGGRLSVVTELKIDGDVDFKTGHVSFDGNVVVTGCVQSGFRVEAHHLTANEISGAIIKATGDVKVAGGIISAQINSQGNIEAKYIRESKLSAYGNISAAKEIADSTIETSGSCVVASGRLFASSISAKQSIQAKDIGTETSAPCKLAIGVDAHIEQELDGLKKAISKREEKREQLKMKLGMLDVEQQTMHQKITQLAHVQDRSQVEMRTTRENLAKLKSTAPDIAVADAERKIKELEQKAMAAETELNSLFDRQEQVEKRMAEIEHERKQLKGELEEFKEEKQSIIEWSKQQKTVSAVAVSGQIHAGTFITGVYTKTRIRELLSRVRIQEVKLSDPDADNEWEMRISPIK